MKLRQRQLKGGGRSFYIDFRHNGQRQRKRLEGISDRKTAEIAFAEFKVRYSRGQANLPTNEALPLGECLKDHLAVKRGEGCVPKYVGIVEAQALQAERAFGEHLPVKNLSEKRVQQWRAELLATGQTPSTINRKVRMLRAAINQAVRSGKVSVNPLENIGNLSDSRREVWRWLSQEEVAALLGVLRDGVEKTVKRRNGRNYKTVAGKNPELYALILFLLSTGARRGEALALTWKEVDFGRGMVALHTTKAAARGRRAKARHVPMTPALREILETLPREGQQVFSISRNNLRRKFERVCELAEIGHCRIHDLRHTFASHLVMAGTPLNTVRELLGHTSMQMTLRYAHLAPEAAQTAIEALPFGGSSEAAQIVEIGG